MKQINCNQHVNGYAHQKMLFPLDAKKINYFRLGMILGFMSFLASIPALSFSQAGAPGLKELVEMALKNSQQLKIKEAGTQKAILDKRKAYEAYLPKVSAEATYTRLNDDIVFPAQFQSLLMGTQQLLIKEAVAMQMQPMPIPDAAKVNFGTAYTNATLADAVSKNLQPIPPIQEKNITKASVNAQMLLFSGMKVPYSIKAANHQVAAMQYLTDAERIVIINNVITTYDKLAVIYQSEQALDFTEKFLNEQKRFVEKAYANGLVINLNRQKIELAMQQVRVKRIELNANKKLLFYKIEELTGYQSDSVSLLKPQLAPWILGNNSGTAADRPDIKALDEAIQATEYKRKSELADYTPKIVAFGKKELLTDDLSMLDPKWYAGVGLKWNIFDGLSSHNSAKQAKLDRIILENRKSEAIELANLNLRKITYDIEKNLQLIETAKLQVKLTEDMLDLSKKQFEQGLITLNEHLSALNDYEKAQLDYVQAIAQERSSVSDYLASCGQLNMDAIH